MAATLTELVNTYINDHACSGCDFTENTIDIACEALGVDEDDLPLSYRTDPAWNATIDLQIESALTYRETFTSPAEYADTYYLTITYADGTSTSWTAREDVPVL